MKSIFVLAVGGEEFLTERAITQAHANLKETYPEAYRATVDASESSAANNIAAAATPNLFDEARTIVITNTESAEPETISTIVSIAEKQTPDLAIVVCHTGGTKGKKHVAALKSVGATEANCFPVKRGKPLIQFLTNEMRAHKISATTETITLLIDTVGTSLRSLAAACDQIASDSPARHITDMQVRETFGTGVDVSLFTLAETIMNKQTVKSLALLRAAMETGGTKVGPGLIAVLTPMLRQQAHFIAIPAGTPDTQMASQIQVPPWKVRQISSRSRMWTPQQIAGALTLLSETDAALKGGATNGNALDNAQKLLLLEKTVSQLTLAQ